MDQYTPFHMAAYIHRLASVFSPFQLLSIAIVMIMIIVLKVSPRYVQDFVVGDRNDSLFYNLMAVCMYTITNKQSTTTF